MTKVNVLLAKTDTLAASFKSNLKDYIGFFKNKQGAFQGLKKTYDPKPGTIDVPSMRGNTLVQTTGYEKLDWFEQTQKEYIDALFSQERSNAAGYTVPLIADGVNFGSLTALELLRLKSLLESSELKEMYENLPVRSDAKVWKPSTNEDYTGRFGIFESEQQKGVNKTTEKESYILPDPNASVGRAPQVAQKTTVMELGDYTTQEFTGEISHRERAEILRRRQNLLVAVIAALKEANDIEATPSTITAESIFGYLHRGKI